MEESGIWDGARKSTAIMFRQEREEGTSPGHNGLAAKGNPFPSVLAPFPPVTSLCLSPQHCPSLGLAAITPHCNSLRFYWLCCFSCMNVSYEHFACVCLVYNFMPSACPLVGSRVILQWLWLRLNWGHSEIQEKTWVKVRSKWWGLYLCRCPWKVQLRLCRHGLSYSGQRACDSIPQSTCTKAVK